MEECMDTDESPAEITSQPVSTTEASTGANLPAPDERPKKETSLKLSLSNVGTFKDLVETGGKVSLITISACYVLGIIVINVHLGRYGIYSLNLLRVSYITAGLWSIVPLVLPVLVLVAAWRIFFRSRLYTIVLDVVIKHRRETNKHERFVITSSFMAIYMFITFVPIFGYLLITAALTAGITPDRGWKFSFEFAIIGTLVLLSLTVGSSFERGFPRFRRETKDKPLFDSLAETSRVFLFISVPVIILLHTIYFGLGQYESIPSYLGGGKPITVQFSLEAQPNFSELIDNCGIHFHTNADQKATDHQITRTDDASLLFVTESEYIFKCNSGGSLSIPRNSIKAIFYKGVRAPGI
jgi:hypothetical protein